MSTQIQPLVRAIYLTPSDMGVPLEAEMKAKANILLNTQRFYAKEMNRHGYGYKTFNLETDGDGKVIFHNIKGKKTLRQYGDINLIVDEVNNALGEGFKDENGLRVVYVAGFDVKNKNRIHQSFLKCVSRNEAVGWGTLSAGTFTIEFNVHRKMFLKSDKVQLHTMDVEGNQFFNELTINLNDAPAAPSNLEVKTIVIWAELKKTDSKQVDN